MFLPVQGFCSSKSQGLHERDYLYSIELILRRPMSAAHPLSAKQNNYVN